MEWKLYNFNHNASYVTFLYIRLLSKGMRLTSVTLIYYLYRQIFL
jgi:hypothetical protein